jgi:hypothetical protein
VSGDVAIDAWLTEQGYGLPGSKPKARATLEEAGLTRAGKLRMSDEKLPRALEALRAKYCLHCASPECVGFAKGSGRQPLPCDPKSTCERCGGSDNRRAATDLIEACRRKGIARLVVVGGSPAVRQELEATLGSALQLRLVDGTERRTIDHSKADLEWGDLVLLWGASELHHKVSMQYTNLAEFKRKGVRVQLRGVAALLHAAVEHLKL